MIVMMMLAVAMVMGYDDDVDMLTLVMIGGGCGRAPQGGI